MRIDDRVERLLRATMDAAVHRDTPRFEKALRKFRDAESVRQAVDLALAISAFVLFQVFNGKPSATQISELAARMSRQEKWMGLTAADVESLLGGMLDGEPPRAPLVADTIMVPAILVATNLVASASKPKQGEWWFNYLDKIETAIETP
nr:hypothetical protein [Micromonospora sp. DSM 115978]